MLPPSLWVSCLAERPSSQLCEQDTGSNEPFEVPREEAADDLACKLRL